MTDVRPSDACEEEPVTEALALATAAFLYRASLAFSFSIDMVAAAEVDDAAGAATAAAAVTDDGAALVVGTDDTATAPGAVFGAPNMAARACRSRCFSASKLDRPGAPAAAPAAAPPPLPA